MAVYLDNAATTCPCGEAVCAFENSITTYGNPSSLHSFGLNAQLLVDTARKQLGSALGVPYEQVFFTSGATESNNLALRGVFEAVKRSKNKIVTSSVEHPSVANTCKELERQGATVVRISPKGNKLNADDFISAVDDKTAIVTMMYANNENGALLPVKEVFTAVKRKYPDVVTHCDLVQAFCKLPFNAKRFNADLVTVSGHKIHAFKGVGALYINKATRVLPIVFGGGQENGYRSGTEAVGLISAFGAAVEANMKDIAENYKKALEIHDYAVKCLSDIDSVSLNIPQDKSPYVLNFSVVGIRSEIMLHFLESRDIYVSSGSACSKGAKSGVLSEFGVNDKNTDSAIRISFSKYTKLSEIDDLIIAIKDGINTIYR